MAKKTFSTDRQVASLKLIEGQKTTDYSHKTEKGLAVRIGLTQKTWRVTYSLNGQRKRYTLPLPYPQCTLEQATNECRRIRGESLKGDDPLGERIKRKRAATIADVVELYLKETPLTDKGQRESERIYKKDILPILGHLKAQDLERHHVKALHSAIVNRRAPIMANRVIELMRRAFNHAFEEELIKTNNFPAIRKMKKEEPTRDRFLTDEEIQKLWPAMDELSPNMRDIHKLLLLTGQRTQDVCSMKIADINVERKEWTVPAPPRGKNKKPNTLPLPPLAWEIIEQRLNQKGEWIFPSKHNTTRPGYTGRGHVNTTKHARNTLTKITGVEGWTGHDLRRTLRTLLSRAGILPHIAERVIGHIQQGVEGIYDRYAYLEEKKQALLKIEKMIRKIAGLNQPETTIIQFPRTVNE